MFQRSFATCVLFGLAAWLAAETVEAQGPGVSRGRGPRGGLMSLAAAEPVQKELGLSADDAAKVTKISETYREEMRGEMSKVGGGGGFQNLSDDERKKLREKMADVLKTLDAKFVPQLKEVLKADQFTRLQQISWQAGGSQALADADLAKSLELSKEQQEKIAAINQEYGQKQRALFAGGAGGGDRQEGRTKMDELGTERNAKAVEVLTKDQQEKFAKLKGKPFDLAQLRSGGPGGRQPQQKSAEKKE